LYTYDGDIWVGLMTVKEAIEHAAGLDVEGIEFFDKMHLPNYPHPTAYDLLGLKEYVEFFGMAVSCYSFYIDTLIHSEKKATFEEEGKQVKDALGAAKVLGAKIVRVAEQVHWLTIQYITLAERYGLKMGVEIHSPIPAKLIFGEKETEDNPARCLVPKLV